MMEEKPRKEKGVVGRGAVAVQNTESNQHRSVILQACYKCLIFFFFFNLSWGTIFFL